MKRFFCDNSHAFVRRAMIMVFHWLLRIGQYLIGELRNNAEILDICYLWYKI